MIFPNTGNPAGEGLFIVFFVQSIHWIIFQVPMRVYFRSRIWRRSFRDLSSYFETNQFKRIYFRSRSRGGRRRSGSKGGPARKRRRRGGRRRRRDRRPRDRRRGLGISQNAMQGCILSKQLIFCPPPSPISLQVQLKFALLPLVSTSSPLYMRFFFVDHHIFSPDK